MHFSTAATSSRAWAQTAGRHSLVFEQTHRFNVRAAINSHQQCSSAWQMPTRPWAAPK